jgi:hypothetical protein
MSMRSPGTTPVRCCATWTATQTTPATHQWRTPSGRVYQTQPATYPA